MRAIACVVSVFLIITSSLAQPWSGRRDSKDLGRTLGDALVRVAVGEGVRLVERELNRKRVVEPRYAGQLPRLVTNQTNGSGWCHPGNIEAIAEVVFGKVGFTVLSRDGRDMARAEMRETSGPEFNPDTAQPMGTLDGSELYASVVVSQGQGAESRSSTFSPGMSTDVGVRSVWAQVIVRICDQTGRQIASTVCEASDSAVSLDLAKGWCSGVRYRGYQPTREDLAVTAAITKAANAVGKEVAGKVKGWRFDPETGRRLSPAQVLCPACLAELPERAKFCPKCGQKL